jgi:hypothetical protein
MVLREDNGWAARTFTVSGPQMRAQLPAHEQLVFQPDGHRRAEAAESGRRIRQIRLEQPIELDQRLLVEGDVVEVRELDACLAQAIFDRVLRK